ncbi:hypothetical protein D3Y57_06900 [Sphingomonas paeninsulae]|uniref:Uncharacterized protein n=1 Tax=Sphingomonas paeninsulae TaxID=2319844 RepID=A0A494TKV8_SPHPE|nr:hypothetical protein [Sphingomonas paeninsulae]AYJ85745.1 hypothetical protein D3Y57_06900 [Sphingomonas paeninsulae]
MPDTTIPPNWQGRTAFNQDGPIRMTNPEPFSAQDAELLKPTRLRVIRQFADDALVGVVFHKVKGEQA